jgi:hypothetical protein
MKKICTIAFVILLSASMAFGDEVDEGLSNMATEQLRASAREMIRYGIDSEHAIKMTRNMLTHQFREEHILRAHEIIMNAKRKGLPVEPLMEKAYEGMAKRVQDRNIVQAIEKVGSRYASAYRHAKGLTQEKDKTRDIGNLIAQGLAAGLHDEGVGEIAHKLQERAKGITKADMGELAVETFRTARDMVRLGAPSMAVTDTVGRALEHGYSAKDMKTMRDSFIIRMRHPSSATDFANNHANSTTRGKSLAISGPSSRGGGGSTRKSMGPSSSGGSRGRH